MRIKKYYKLIRVDYEDSAYMRLKNVSNEVGIFKMVKTGGPIAPNLEYSLDGVTWTTYDFSTLPEVTVAAGTNIYFRGTNSSYQFNKNTSDYVTFSFNKTCEGHGNMCSLFDPDPAVFSRITTIGSSGLAYAFHNCTSLVTAPDLSSVTTIGTYGLAYAFHNCTSLVTGPDLSSVTTVYGMRDCFNGCTSLVTAPDLSSVTTIGKYSLQNAFYGCTSLVTGPDLSSVTNVHGTGDCASMLYGCTSLTTATTPNIQDFTSNSVLNNWLQNAGTSATGTKTVNVPTGATITTGSTSGIPTGWTRVDY